MEYYKYTFLLHALGDTIGFKNSDWEMASVENPIVTLDTVNEMIFEFIDLGGINGIDIKDWIVSDDTLYHIAIAKALIEYKKLDEDFIYDVKEKLITMHNRMINEEKQDGIFRYPGSTTNKFIQKFTDTKDGRNLTYDVKSGGNGACMRNLCIGLAFPKESQIDELIDVSITLSKLTHNSALGYLAGLTSALMTMWAINKVPINQWVFKLMDLLESDKVKKHVNMKNNDEFLDYISYIRYWKKYIDTRFVDNKPIKTRSFGNMLFRTKYYYENFVKDSITDFIGGSGFCAMIMAYNALIDCDGKWEKIVFYSILFPGDSDTVGSIACGLYGAYYGLGDVPKYMLEHIEEKDVLIELGEKFFKKFH